MWIAPFRLCGDLIAVIFDWDRCFWVGMVDGCGVVLYNNSEILGSRSFLIWGVLPLIDFSFVVSLFRNRSALFDYEIMF